MEGDRVCQELAVLLQPDICCGGMLSSRIQLLVNLPQQDDKPYVITPVVL